MDSSLLKYFGPDSADSCSNYVKRTAASEYKIHFRLSLKATFFICTGITPSSNFRHEIHYSKMFCFIFISTGNNRGPRPSKFYSVCSRKFPGWSSVFAVFPFDPFVI